MTNTVSVVLPFYLSFYLSFCRGQKRRAPIIGATCAFDAKIYKIVDGIFDVSAFVIWNKKIFKLFYFWFQLPSFLIDLLEKILPILTPETKELTADVRRYT